MKRRLRGGYIETIQGKNFSTKEMVVWETFSEKKVGSGAQGTIVEARSSAQPDKVLIAKNLGRVIKKNLLRELSAANRISPRNFCNPDLMCIYGAAVGVTFAKNLIQTAKDDPELKMMLQNSLSLLFVVEDWGSKTENANRVTLFYEYVNGVSLQTVINRNLQFDPFLIAYQLFLALNDMHKLDVVHRDLKPANIVLEITEGQAYPFRIVLVDFGLTCILSECDRKSAAFGTPDYLAPDLQIPDTIVEDLNQFKAGDVYASGCVMYALLTGEPPLTSISDIVNFVVSDQEVVLEFPMDTPETLQMLVQSCVRRTWQERPTVSQILDTYF
jgi:serine/threonine protein kinase